MLHHLQTITIDVETVYYKFLSWGAGRESSAKVRKRKKNNNKNFV